jgi:hypothetical protein
MLSKGYWFAAVSLSVAMIALAQTAPQPAKTPVASAATTTATTTAGKTDGGIPAWVKPETPAQRAQRLGTPEDPGLDPNEKHIFYRFGKRFHIEKTPRRWAAYKDLEEGLVRPYAMANFTYEIYQQNDEYVWWWVPEPEETPKAEASDAERGAEGAYANYTEAQLKYLKKIQPEFSILNPPQSPKTIHFEESSEGLPTAGSWRNSLAVADMNEDGFPDIIVPPQRGGGGSLPIIFLGDGKGHWKIWDTVVWPYGVQYGGVAAADFNTDCRSMTSRRAASPSPISIATAGPTSWPSPKDRCRARTRCRCRTSWATSITSTAPSGPPRTSSIRSTSSAATISPSENSTTTNIPTSSDRASSSRPRS